MPNDLTGKKILVTGATGFLGSHLLALLAQTNAEISCLVRSPHAKLLPGVKIIHGDCLDLTAMRKAAEEQDIVIHAAALLFGYDWQNYLAANSAAARNLAAAISQGRQRLILVSSLAAAGPCAMPPGRDERQPPQPVSAYGWSKLISEQILQAAINDRLVILRPPIIYGSGDKGLLPLFKSCLRGLGLSPGMRDFPVSITHAADAARAILLACNPEASGIYHLDDGNKYTMEAICRTMGAALGKKQIFVAKPPLTFMGATAALSSGANWLLRKTSQLLKLKEPKPPIWNLDKFRESSQAGWLANSERIVRELGFRPQMSLEMGMAEAVSGYRARGWL